METTNTRKSDGAFLALAELDTEHMLHNASRFALDVHGPVNAPFTSLLLGNITYERYLEMVHAPTGAAIKPRPYSVPIGPAGLDRYGMVTRYAL